MHLLGCRVFIKLPAYPSLVDQRFGPAVVRAALLEGGARRNDACVRDLDLRVLELLLRSDLRYGRLLLRDRRFGIRDARLIVDRIDLHEQLSWTPLLIVVDRELRHIAGPFRRDESDTALHIGIVARWEDRSGGKWRCSTCRTWE